MALGEKLFEESGEITPQKLEAKAGIQAVKILALE
jgi:hypothetical protein